MSKVKGSLILLRSGVRIRSPLPAEVILDKAHDWNWFTLDGEDGDRQIVNAKAIDAVFDDCGED